MHNGSASLKKKTFGEILKHLEPLTFFLSTSSSKQSRQDEIDNDATDIKRDFLDFVREIEGDDVDVQNERKFEEEKKTEETVKKNFDQKSKLKCIGKCV